MTADAFVDSDDSDSNWAKSTKKSYKECIKSTETFSAKLGFYYGDIGENKQAVYVDCAATGEQKISADADAARFGVNNHWYRNFDTD